MKRLYYRFLRTLARSFTLYLDKFPKAPNQQKNFGEIIHAIKATPTKKKEMFEKIYFG